MSADWHARTAEEVVVSLESSVRGLTRDEAASRLASTGPNALPQAPPVSLWTLLRHQLASVVVVLLLAAMVVTLLLGDRIEAGAIAAVLAINTAIGFVTELRARRAMEALQRFDEGRATVWRDGGAADIDVRDVVPGDIVLLDAGANVPADARLVEASDLRANEAALTGESLPVSKDARAPLEPATPLADRRTMVYKGTSIAAGTARAVVVATGRDTELGRIGGLVAGVVQERTPLELRLDALGRRLIWLTLGIAAVVSVLGAAQGLPAGLVIESGIALAVAAVPEALPTVVTIALAVGMRRMTRRHALVRRLPAVETLGSTTVVCTDKTLTLTTGEMKLAEVWPFQVDERTVVETAVIASGAVDPMDDAIRAEGERRGLTRAEVVASLGERGDVPFSSERKYAAVFAGDRVFVKGAPIVLLDRSAIDAAQRERIRQANAEMAGRGLRVLAFASAPAAGDASETAIQNLRFEGLGGFIDPPAEGVKDAIATLKGAGLRTVMITGDQKLTAEAIARDLGVDGVYSRVTPEDKLRIVEDLQQRGEIVAMLGDGVNDAAALKRANVGVAMGRRGTDVAKEAAAIVLQDDRFGTIAAAVEEGRVIYANIRKFVFYLFSCNLAEVLVLLAAAAAGMPMPLLPLQLLWLNMLTDTFPALALAVEPADPDVMLQPPRDPREALLSRGFVLRILLYAALIVGATLAVFGWALTHAPERATTMAFMTLAFAQILHLGNARSAGAVVRPSAIFANPWAIAGAATAAALQTAAIAVPSLRQVLHLEPLMAGEWFVVVACAAVPAVFGQAWKVMRSVEPVAAPR